MFGPVSDFAAPFECSAQPKAAPIPASGKGLEFSAYGIRKAFRPKVVLADFNLVARPGEFVAIVGRSGCGKSTFLRPLAGLDAPDTGLVGFGAEGRSRGASDVRVMFQEPRLLP